MPIYTPGKRGTIRHAADYGISDACVKLYEAMKGLGTNESVIIDVLSNHTVEQRQQIKKQYQTLYGKDLLKELDSELSFSFLKLVQALMVDPNEYVLDCINKCICSVSDKQNRRLFKRLSSIFREGLGGKEYICMGLLCGKSNAELEEIKKIYKKTFGSKLEDKITEDGNNMSTDFCSFVLDMTNGEREEEGDVDMETVAEDVEALVSSSNEDVLHQLLQERSFAHLRKVFDEMMDSGKTIHSLVDDLQGQISVEMVDAYRGMVTLIKDGEPSYWADRVKGAIDGAGTDDDTLIKTIVLRAEIDLVDIMDMYEIKYKRDMAADVADDTSGDYKMLLSKILVRPPPETEVDQSGLEEGTEKNDKASIEPEEAIETKVPPLAEQRMTEKVEENEKPEVTVDVALEPVLISEQNEQNQCTNTTEGEPVVEEPESETVEIEEAPEPEVLENVTVEAVDEDENNANANETVRDKDQLNRATTQDEVDDKLEENLDTENQVQTEGERGTVAEESTIPTSNDNDKEREEASAPTPEIEDEKNETSPVLEQSANELVTEDVTSGQDENTIKADDDKKDDE